MVRQRTLEGHHQTPSTDTTVSERCEVPALPMIARWPYIETRLGDPAYIGT
jgi:hypothetical protein